MDDVSKPYPKLEGLSSLRLLLLLSPRRQWILFFSPTPSAKPWIRALKNFWWGFPKGKTRNLSLKSWRSICIPRYLGSLGICNMRDVNFAWITKLGWKLLSNVDWVWVNQFINIFDMDPFYLHRMSPLHNSYGYGNVFFTANHSSSLDRVCRFQSTLISPYGPLPGFLLYQTSSLLRNIHAIRNSLPYLGSLPSNYFLMEYFNNPLPLMIYLHRRFLNFTYLFPHPLNIYGLPQSLEVSPSIQLTFLFWWLIVESWLFLLPNLFGKVFGN
jgi:hypothetical protein